MSKSLKLIGILVIFYTVGVIGVSFSPWKDLLLALTPLVLLMSFTILIIAREHKKTEWYYFLAFCGLVGWTVEWVGVHTGLLFGDYAYGENLGPKLLGIPLMISVNWCLVTITSASIAGHLKFGKFLNAFVAATLMVVLDFAIEPVAIQSDFWTWAGGVIPFFNYVCWFVVGWILQLVLHFTELNETNKVNDGLLVIMLLFFLSLNFLN